MPPGKPLAAFFSILFSLSVTFAGHGWLWLHREESAEAPVSKLTSLV